MDTNPQPESPAAAKPSRGKIFVQRSISATILWGALLASLFLDDQNLAKSIFLLLMMLLAGFGLQEFYTIMAKAGQPAYRRLGIMGGLLMVVGVFLFVAHRNKPDGALTFEVLWISAFTLLVFLTHLSAEEKGASISVTVLGIIYVPVLLGFIQQIRFYNADGPWYLLLFILATKLSDTGAYVVGSLVGRHKMVPSISPGKTWEGFAGALIFSIAAACLLFHFAPGHFRGMTMLNITTLGLLLGLGAVLGDLIESKLKRDADVKDSGQSLPGIGGVLDLLDSLLFNAPLMYLYLKVFLPVLKP